ncbi:MAG: hypothetical protein FJ316_01760 [SAR202 cluster bacterium]|nr:hypothetical protein [SAR202 cluster bacterium]
MLLKSNVIRVTLTPDRVLLPVGREVQAQITVQNAGFLVDAFSIEVLGLDNAWYSLSRSSLSLFPGEEAASTITFRLPSRNEAVAQPYPFTVRVTSAKSPQEVTTEAGVLEVEPSLVYEASLSPEKVTGRRGAFTLTLANGGNAGLSFGLAGEDPERYCRFTFEPAAPTTPPRSKAEVAISVRPRRRPIIGRPKTYNLTITVTPDKTPEVRTLRAQLDAVAWIRWWYIPATLLALVVMAILGYTAYWAIFARENWTYFRQEKWDLIDIQALEKIEPGKVYSFPFQLVSRSGGPKAPIPEGSVAIRGNVIWDDTFNAAPSVQVTLEHPHGNCKTQREGREDAPFDFEGIAVTTADVQDEWIIYIENDDFKDEIPRNGRLFLKAAVSTGHRPEKNPDYMLVQQALSTVSEVHPCRTDWDDEMILTGQAGEGLEHGIIFTRPLDISQKVISPPAAIQELLIDATWEREGDGAAMVQSIFVVLRDPQGHCWTTQELQTSELERETLFIFPVGAEKVPCRDRLVGRDLWNFINWITYMPSSYQGAQPLVRFCQHANGTALFDDSNSIPRVFEASSDGSSADPATGWRIYLMNPDELAPPPVVRFKVRGDDDWQVFLREPASVVLGPPPLGPAGVCGGK